MDQAISLIVYPVTDLARAQALYRGKLTAWIKDAGGNTNGLMQAR